VRLAAAHGDSGLECASAEKLAFGLFSDGHGEEAPCAQYAHMKDFTARYKTIKDSLQDLSRGGSTSEVFAPLAKRTTGHFSINIHAPSGQYPVLACGDIPKR
jgi:hypothetical protein